jgi:hypothetical protein
MDIYLKFSIFPLSFNEKSHTTLSHLFQVWPRRNRKEGLTVFVPRFEISNSLILTTSLITDYKSKFKAKFSCFSIFFRFATNGTINVAKLFKYL